MHNDSFYDTEGLKVTEKGNWNDLDALMRHPTSGARSAVTQMVVLRCMNSGGVMFVGSQTAAKSLDVLQEHNITHVVNCTGDMPLYHEQNGITYLRFNITGALCLYWRLLTVRGFISGHYQKVTLQRLPTPPKQLTPATCLSEPIDDLPLNAH